MLRFLATCLLVASLCVVGVLGVSYLFPQDRINPDPEPERPVAAAKAVEKTAVKESPAAPQPREIGPAELARDDQPVGISEVKPDKSFSKPIVINDGQIKPGERVEVPAERDGKLLLLGTPVDETEFNRLPEHRREVLEFPVLGVEAAFNEEIRPGELIEDPERPGVRLRLPRTTDSFAPGTIKVIRKRFLFRRLQDNDLVNKGDVLGIINPALALEEVLVKESKVVAAVSEVATAAAMKEESKRRLAAIDAANARVPNTVSKDDREAARVTIIRYQEEEKAKAAAVLQSQRELAAAWTVLQMHMIRSPMNGQIRTIYKFSGDACKNLEPVLQLQDIDHMRVEAQVDVQDALPLAERLRRAKRLRQEADRKSRELGSKGDEHPEVRELRRRADQLVAVQIEASQPTPPVAVLSGHLQEVNAVAVTRGSSPRIVSASEEGLVRIWQRQAGSDRWQEQIRLDHRAPVRAVACSGPKVEKFLMATGTSTGRVRFFDLERLRDSEQIMADRHKGPVNVLAFSPDGKLCASGGEDYSICLWDVAQGKLLSRKVAAHMAAVTSLSFTPEGKLVSAGRDKRLILWNLSEGKLEKEGEESGRSNDVAVLGLDPSGDRVLYDEGRELRVLSWSSKRIEGVLVNRGNSGAFSTMALFSPDGHLIMTNGNAPGRLQLWRAPTDKDRAAELRQLLWSNGTVTCGAFAPEANFAVTGTSDHRVLVWELPQKSDYEKPLSGELSYIEEFLDTGLLKRITVRASFRNPGNLIPGSLATVLIPPVSK